MRAIPEKMKRDILEKYPNKCARAMVFHDHECQGRLTLEHVWTYGGPQINEVWAILKICAWAHDVDEHQDGGNLDKAKHQYISVMLASPEDLAKYPRKNWGAIRFGLQAALAEQADLSALDKLRKCLR